MQPRKSHRARQSPPSELFRIEPQAPKMSEEDFAEIRAVVVRETLADLSDYRAELVEAGLARRMVRRRTERMPEYIRFVRQFAGEATELLNRRSHRRRDLDSLADRHK